MALLDKLEQRVILEQQAIQAQLVLKVIQVPLALLVLQARQVQLVLKVIQARQVQLVLKVIQELLVQLEQMVLIAGIITEMALTTLMKIEMVMVSLML